jgi:phthalate 4,5-dioxygenase
MLPRQENELLARVGAGTPMGQTMRLYWTPRPPSASRMRLPTANQA